MKITRDKLFSGILFFGLTTILLVLFDIQYFYLRAISSFVFLTTIPGLLIMLILKIRKIGFWEYFIYTIGLSIAYLMFAGLAVNWILPWLHITDKPLSLVPLLTSFSIILSIFGITAYKRNKNISLKIILSKPNLLNKVFFTAPIIFPILSILGATTLNNGGPNYLTMIMLGGIAAYIFLIVLFRNKLNGNIFPFAILCIALSLLLMTSLRGWNITGHDIKREYYVFQLTNNNAIWKFSNYVNAYNSCLSITILPTIISKFLNLNDIYIYKFFYQILFSLVPITIFVTIKKLSTITVAFFSSIFFMIFPLYLNDITFLNRQEIAFIFFSLMMHILFCKFNNILLNKFLFILFGILIIVSLYSTTYYMLGILILGYFLLSILKLLFYVKKILIKSIKTYDTNIYLSNFSHSLSAISIVILLCFTILWNFNINKTSDGALSIFKYIVTNMNKALHEDAKNSNVSYSLFSFTKIEPELLYKNYIYTTLSKRKLIKTTELYDEDLTSKYSINMLPPSIHPLTKIGEILQKSNISSSLLNVLSRQYIAKLIQVFIILGITLLLFSKKYKSKICIEYKIISLAVMSLILVNLLIPRLTYEYNLLRAFQQGLIVLSFSGILGILFLFKFLKENIRILLTGSLLIIFFLSLSGLVPQLTGGYYPQLNLNNSGDTYDAFYTHTSELYTIKWLSNNKDNNIIQTSYFSKYNLDNFSNLNSSNDIIPALLQKSSYVYLGYLNTVSHKDLIYINGNFIYYQYPIKFIDDNKNLIYNNDLSRIYK